MGFERKSPSHQDFVQPAVLRYLGETFRKSFWRRSFLPITLFILMRTLRQRSPAYFRSARKGNASLDYMLILAAMLPIVLFITVKGKRIMQLVWEMLCVQVSWPLM